MDGSGSQPTNVIHVGRSKNFILCQKCGTVVYNALRNMILYYVTLMHRCQDCSPEYFIEEIVRYRRIEALAHLT